MRNTKNTELNDYRFRKKKVSLCTELIGLGIKQFKGFYYIDQYTIGSICLPLT